MNVAFDVNAVSDRKDWEHRLRDAGVYEREQERERFLSMLDMSLGTNAEESDEPLIFEEWLRESVDFPECNYCSYSLARLRQLDRWLWEYEPVPFSHDSITSYLFVWDDVVRARETGLVTTLEQWERLVNERYYEEWERYRSWVQSEDACQDEATVS